MKTLLIIIILAITVTARADVKCGSTIKTEQEFRLVYPNTFFPVPLTDRAIREKGCTPYTAPVVPQPPQVPESVSPAQARRILNKYGLRSTVEAIVANLDQDSKDLWQFATEIRRDNLLLNAVCRQAGMTDAQIDTMFTEASQL